MKKNYMFLLALMLVLAGAFYYSPRATLMEIDRAIQENDQVVMDSKVNYSNLRGLATTFINGKLELKRRIESQTDFPMALRDYSTAMGMVDKVVNSLMTPKGFVSMAKGNLDYVNNKAVNQSVAPLFSNSRIKFDSLTRAHALVDQDEPGLQTTIVLKRVGLYSWRIESMGFPVDAMFDNLVKQLEG